ncbi:MAG TPA: zinc ribbon domain-containing protein, partial [Dehalococcoidales bacterium]|nr:zinc ribbon domain-containing protein [Dehalococcoidales bacterium]
SKGRIYLLKSVIKCGKCGLTYVSCLNRGQVWYRCNGHLTGRGPLEGRCSSKDIKGVHLEPVIWADIESFIRHPGEDIIKELSSERDCDKSIDTEQIERQNLEKALEQLASRRKNAIDLRTRDRISDNELDELLAQISKEQSKAEERLSILCREAPEPTPPVGDDILAEIRSRLANLTPLEKQEIVRLLVKRVTINTEGVDKNRTVKAVVEYRFTQPVAVPTGSGKDSLHR